MTLQDRAVRACIFAATGYLCSGIVITIAAGLSFWTAFLESSTDVAVLVTLLVSIVSGAAGIMLMRFLVPRFGLKPIFEQDVLILMIGMLFISLTVNKGMMIVGLAVTSGAVAVYFFENYKLQVNEARKGGANALKLAGWALGPVIAVTVIQLFSEYGLIIVRLLFAHYIIIAFWVWIQRLNLHTDYSEVPDSLLELIRRYREKTGADNTADEEKKDEAGKESSPVKRESEEEKAAKSSTSPDKTASESAETQKNNNNAV